MSIIISIIYPGL